MLGIFEAAVKMDIGNPWGKPTVHLTEIHQWSLQNSTQMGQEWMKTCPKLASSQVPPPSFQTNCTHYIPLYFPRPYVEDYTNQECRV